MQNNKKVRFIFSILLLGGLIGLIFARNSVAAPPTQTRLPDIEVEPELWAQINTNQRDQKMDSGYLIYFHEAPDLSPAYQMDWVARGEFVVAALQQTAETSQAAVRAYLDSQGVDYQAFWIDNIIVVHAGSTPTTFNGLLKYAEISALRTRRQPMLYEPEAVEINPRDLAVPVDLAANIAHVKADQVWDMGYTGEGIVVANIDTGVLYTHEALVGQYRGNMGVSFDHNYNWWDPALGGQSLVPSDWHNHGSHTMGTMIGDDGAGDQIGMAPGAQWIACKAFQDGTTDDELLECGQFMLAPYGLEGPSDHDHPPDSTMRPHVINNSWGDCGRSLDDWYKDVINSWLAAGIYPVFSNGNTSNCSYSSPPDLNTVGNPGRYGNVTGVGSTGNSNGEYASHSNWGPTDDLDTINPAGYPNLKPQVVAPGVSIRSAYKTSDTTYGTMTGTSMSAPHVSGLVALMWQAAPCLVGDYATTERIIEQTVNPVPYDTGNGDEGPGNIPNHATGWGEIDALQAVLQALDYCSILISPANQSVCAPGEAVYSVWVGNAFSGAVSLSVVDLPTAATAAFNHNPATPGETTPLTITLSGAAAAGRHAIAVTGSTITHTFTSTATLEIFAVAPTTPDLSTPADGDTAQVVRPGFHWMAVSGAEQYLLEIAADENFAGMVYSSTLETNAYTLTVPLAYSTPYFWRVTPQNVCGAGTPSTVFTFTTKDAPTILLVDDDDNDPDVRAYYTTTLAALNVTYEIWDTQNSDNEPALDYLANFNTLIWFTGEEWDSKTGPGATGETALANWLDGAAGRCLFLSSQDYHYAREFTSFMDVYLGITAITNDVWQTSVSGTGFRFDGLGPYTLSYPYSNWSDQITPDDGVQAAFVGNQGTAGVAKNTGGYKTVFMAFPFEALPTAAARQDVLQAVLNYCGPVYYYFPLIAR